MRRTTTMVGSRAALSSLALALGGLLLGGPGCFSLDLDGDGDIDVPPRGGDESDYISCSNGRDDDLDGRIDCEDSDCLMRGHCGEQIPILPPVGYENTFETCSNGIDDDEDGQFDCGDRGCQNIQELCCAIEFDDASCSNLLDDDGNGFADCADFSCRNNPYVTVCNAETDCGDGLDNDGDRLADCRDEDCLDIAPCSESDDDECRNGDDDDGDGLVDCEDPTCSGSAPCPAETDCTNGADEDGDGRTDCEDRDCYMEDVCLGPEGSLARCSDGNDNDGNGFTDCGDFACTMESRGATPEAVMFCATRPDEDCANRVDDDHDGNVDCDDRDCQGTPACPQEDDMVECFDGVDNDDDGFIDCDDFSCNDVERGNADPAVAAACAEAAESTLEECMNGIDDDGDDFTDCADFSCSRDGDPDAVEFCSTISETSFANCRDRIDNDRNGFTDCADFGCQFSSFVLGTQFCDTAADCPGANYVCRETRLSNPESRSRVPFCFAECAGAGDCAPGWECQNVTVPGGSLPICVHTCSTDADCPLGDSCFAGACLAIRSPCSESVFANEDSNFQEDSAITTATCGEQLAMATRSCTDGVDGDRDGFADCYDWECNHNPRVRVVPSGLRPDDCFVEQEPGSAVCTPAVGANGVPLCPPLCRYTGGRTCALGPQAGQACATDADCSDIPDACSLPGPRGRELVCPQ